MRNMLVVLLFVLIPPGSTARDNTTTKADGRMWQEYSDSGPSGNFLKAAYVEGTIEGLRSGALAGYLGGRTDEKRDALNYLKPCLDKGPCAAIPIATLIRPPGESTTWAGISTGAEKVRAQFTPRDASVLDVVHQIDKFYSAYRNTPVCMIEAVQEAISSLNGAPSSEKDLETMRKGCNP